MIQNYEKNDMTKLATTHRDLLDEIVSKYGIDERIKSAVLEDRQITVAEKENLIDALLFELTKTGLRLNDEPNERGLQLEELVDLIGGSKTRSEGTDLKLPES